MKVQKCASVRFVEVQNDATKLATLGHVIMNPTRKYS